NHGHAKHHIKRATIWHDRAPVLPRPRSLTAMPAHGLDKIKFATDAPTWRRALALYESGKITNFKSDKVGYSATVHGGHQYHVFVSAHRYDEGSCNCYLGQNDTLCKHMVAVALYAMKGGDPLKDKEKQLYLLQCAVGSWESSVTKR